MTAAPSPTPRALRELPVTTPLDWSVDARALRAELDALDSTPWEPVLVHAPGDDGRHSDAAGWTTLRVRTLGHGVDESPGPDPLPEFRNTPVLAQLPALRSLLDEAPAIVRGARLMAVAPGTRGERHDDKKCGFRWGTVRLHVPIVTGPGAVLDVDGEPCTWPPGAVWYADFSRPHQVVNTGRVTRVHLVMDVTVTSELLDLFPAAFRHAAVRAECPPSAAERALERDPLGGRRFVGDLPAAFGELLESDESLLASGERVPTVVGIERGRLVLRAAGHPAVEMVHVGDDEFRVAGWTTERTLVLRPDGDGGTGAAVLRLRDGARTSEAAFTLYPHSEPDQQKGEHHALRSLTGGMRAGGAS